MDITPLIPKGRLVVEGYGPEGFRIGGNLHIGPVLLLPHSCTQAPCPFEQELDETFLSASSPKPELLLIGCGQKIRPLPAVHRKIFQRQSIAIELMNSGAACRTYNVLMAEGRRVGAFLCPIQPK